MAKKQTIQSRKPTRKRQVTAAALKAPRRTLKAAAPEVKPVVKFEGELPTPLATFYF